MRPLLLIALGLTGCVSHFEEDEPLPPSVSLLRGTPLTALAAEAVTVSPPWVQDDLAVSLTRLDEVAQDDYGALIVDLEEPWLLDEVAFSLAHLSPEVLSASHFYPSLLVDNARQLYAVDDQLPYVQLVEHEGEVDGAWTTAAYQVLTEGGTLEERELPREVYYWRVVHPRLEDEVPAYLDAWVSSAAVRPDSGALWRSFLWDGAALDCPEGRECPMLADRMPSFDYLWAGLPNNLDDNGAIGGVMQFVRDAMEFGAGDERPVQPSRVYTVAQGNCGEHADLTCAAARAALIPCQNVGAKANDHTWNEFWDQGWVSFEPYPGTVDKWTYYADANGAYYRSRDLRDNDCDGVADDGLDTADTDGDGLSVADGDCDDNDPNTHPGAPELPDGRDNSCDGVADEGLGEADADGDGYTLTEGDCDELDPSRHPGAEEPPDGVDHDCDGVALQAPDAVADADADGLTAAAGDCDDTRADTYPDAPEHPDGRDNSCDGVADEGLTLEELDRDGDGYSLAEGDCDDTRAASHPGAADPVPSTNRLFAMTAFRGDTWTGTDRTEDYGTTSTLSVTVLDPDDRPVDGALVTVFGNWGVYGHPEAPTWAAEAVTGLDGVATLTVGEANRYWWAVSSPIGDAPGDQRIYNGPSWTEPGVTYPLKARLPDRLPAAPDAAALTAPGGELSLTARAEVVGARVAANGGLYDLDRDYVQGSFSLEIDGGRVTTFAVDAAQLAAFEGGQHFEAYGVQREAPVTDATLSLPDQGAWYWVVANTDTLASTMIVDVSLSVSDGEAPPAATADHLVLPPGSWAVYLITPSPGAH
ncbi:MAG: hypothetical protein JXX28_12580 [Deltaproteobacteria bacterium]|nr:hypothetical protein [Deltaproteobacteria bacterium]